MIADYEFYQNSYQGDLLSEQQFNKHIGKAQNIISANTNFRVSEYSIIQYPLMLQNNIRLCACELCETIYSYYKAMNDNIMNGALPVKSKKAGALTVVYDTSSPSVTSADEARKAYKRILNDYLYAQNINGTWYNLLSFV